MKIFYPLLALGLWLLLQSCDSKQEALTDASSSTLTLTLTLSDTIYLPLDESTSLSNRLGSTPFYLPEEDKTYFIHTPTSKNTIQVYDIEKASLALEIPYQVTGPDGIKMPAYYTPIAKDSFFIGNHLTNTYALINKEGKVLKRFRWQDKQRIDPFFAGIRHKQQLIFLLSPDYHTLYQFNYTNSAPLKYDSLLLTLDLRTGERKKYFTWPKKYQKYNFLHTDSNNSICRGPGDTLVLSLAASHELYLFDLNHLEAGPIGTVMAKSSMVKLTPMPKGMNPVDASYESSMYGRIIYDPYRKLYYRIGYTLPIKGKMLKSVIPGLQRPKKDVVVLTLDSHFNVIGEDRIDGALIFMGFVTPQGLVFKENYVNQETAPQDAFRFFVFTPKKKE